MPARQAPTPLAADGGRRQNEPRLKTGTLWFCATLFTAALACGVTGTGAQRDSRDWDAERRRMVDEQLSARDIRSAPVLDAMLKVPRHLFVPEPQRSEAYSDFPLPIGLGQTISQPYIVAFMTQALELEPGHRVLEIGTGSGYQAAVLSLLAKDVYTIEILPPLAERARKTLTDLGHRNVEVRAGNGYLGWPEHAPYDRIMVTAAPDEVPAALVQQLKIGGLMAIPVGTVNQELRILRRTATGTQTLRTLPVRFVPMTGKPKGEAAPPVAPPAGPRLLIDGGFERRFDRIRYRFENASSFDTASPVDHFFQQRYEVENNWFIARAGYQSSSALRWSADAGFTPQIAAFGEDLDTFYNPGNNVIVSGTSGEVDMRSIRASGRVERTRRSGLVERIGYSYRRDRSNFRTPERKIVTMSNPPSVQETITFDHETTVSQVHQTWVGWTKGRALSPRWRIDGDVDVSPATVARLTTILPEKYPGRDIVFWATGFELAGRVTIGRNGRWPIEASADAGRAFSYRPSAQLIRHSIGLSIRIGVAQLR